MGGPVLDPEDVQRAIPWEQVLSPVGGSGTGRGRCSVPPASFPACGHPVLGWRSAWLVQPH